jgi:hypothetical protein
MTSDEAQTVIAFLLAAVLVQSAPESYRAVFVRAAPGALTELVDLVKARRSLATGELRPLLLRHAQGDQWDLMILQPIGSLSAYFGTDRSAPDPSWDRLVAWQEELFVAGPPREVFLAASSGAGYFHLEIFQALAGKRDSLTAERRMENTFLGATGRPINLIFTRVAGASWDQFSLGFYRDLQHYAEPTRVSAEREEAAAREAGFDSRSGIGPYLRRFINGHHDTLGSVVP